MQLIIRKGLALLQPNECWLCSRHPDPPVLKVKDVRWDKVGSLQPIIKVSTVLQRPMHTRLQLTVHTCDHACERSH